MLSWLCLAIKITRFLIQQVNSLERESFDAIILLNAFGAYNDVKEDVETTAKTTSRWQIWPQYNDNGQVTAKFKMMSCRV